MTGTGSFHLDDLVDEFFEAVVALGDMGRYLHIWRAEETLPALLHLAEFVTWEGSCLLDSIHDGHALSPKHQQALAFFRQAWVRERLEAAFFAPPPGYNDTEFSEAVNSLDALDRHFKRSNP